MHREDAQASRQNLVFLTRETQKSLLDFLARSEALWPGPWGLSSLQANPGLLDWLFDAPTTQAGLAWLDPWLRLSLSSDQWEATCLLESQPLSFIDGPAGSGKSWLISRLLGVALSQGKRVLVTSPCPGALKDLSHIFPKGPPPGSADLIKRLDRLEQLQFERIKKECNLALAQRRLSQGRGCHDWIPGAIHRGIPMPLSEQEVAELYSLSDLEAEGDSKLHGSLPDPAKLLTVDELARLKDLDEFFRNYEDQLFWANTHHASEALGALLEVTGPLQEMLAQAPEWWLMAAWAAKKGGEDGQAWAELSVKLDRLEREREPLQKKIKAPRFDLPTGPVEEQLAICQELLAHVSAKGNVGWVAFKPRWKRFLEQARVNGTRPSTPEDFGWLAARLKCDLLLAQALEEVRKLMARLSLKGDLGNQDPAPTVRQAVRDFPDFFAEFQKRASTVGLRWEKAMSHSTRSKLPPGGELGLFRVGLTEMLIPLIGRRQQFVELATLRQKEEQHLDWVPATGKVGLGVGGSDKQRDLRSTLRSTVVARDIQGYRESLARLVKIKRFTIYNERRTELLTRLEAVAPEWARAIKEHRSPHDKTVPPGPAEPAWHYLQSQYLLESAADASLDDLAEGIRGIRSQLSEGVLTPAAGLTLRPLEEVLAGPESYDLVLVDHAHRCPLPALGILARGTQVVLLGDLEQLGPAPPGGPVRGGPDERFDGWHSLLELGRKRARLTGGVGLPTDVAELLQRLGGNYPSRPGLAFNALEPLKDYPVQADRQEQEAAALAVTLLRQEEYAGLTVAAVTLGGPDSARRIAQAVEEELDESEQSLFTALDPSQAQGRRFDVVLVCLAERGWSSGPLPLRNNPQYLSQLRVALTRARMQVFVVHALDAARDLVPGDLRRKLLEALSHPAPPDEFPDTFRGSLARDLIKAGYRVRRYDPFGLRLEGRSGAALLFCYSDEAETYTLEDLAREGWLEQAGWRVLGLSGREYWRDPIAFVTRLLGQLQLQTLDPLASHALEARLRESAARVLEGWPRLSDPVEPPRWDANAFPLAWRELGSRLLSIQGARIEPGGEPGTLAQVVFEGHAEEILESEGAGCLERVKQLLASPPPPRPKLVSAAPGPKAGEASGEREPSAGLTPKPGTPSAGPEGGESSLRAGLVQRAGTKGQPPAPAAEGKRGLVERNPDAAPVEGKRGLVERSSGGGSKRGFLDKRPSKTEPAPSAPEVEVPGPEAGLSAPEVGAWPEVAEAGLSAPELGAWPEDVAEAGLSAPEVAAWPEDVAEAGLSAPEVATWPEDVAEAGPSAPEVGAWPEFGQEAQTEIAEKPEAKIGPSEQVAQPEPEVQEPAPPVVAEQSEESPAEPAPLRPGLVQRGTAKGHSPAPEGKRGLVERHSGTAPAEGKRGLVERGPAGGAKRGFLDKRPSKAEPVTPEPEVATAQLEAAPRVELEAAPEEALEVKEAEVEPAGEQAEEEAEQAEEPAVEQAEEEAEQAEDEAEQAEEEAEQAEEEAEQAEEDAEYAEDPGEQAEEEAEQAEEPAEQAEEEAEQAEEPAVEQAEEEAEQAEEEAEQAEEEAEQAEEEAEQSEEEAEQAEEEAEQAEEEAEQAEEEAEQAEEEAEQAEEAMPGVESEQPLPRPEKVSAQSEPPEATRVEAAPTRQKAPVPPAASPALSMPAPIQFQPVVEFQPVSPPPSEGGRPGPPRRPTPSQPLGAPGQSRPVARTPAPAPAEQPPPPPAPEPAPAESEPKPTASARPGPPRPAYPSGRQSAPSSPAFPVKSGKPPSAPPPPAKADSGSTRPSSVKPPMTSDSGSIKPPAVRPPVKAESGSIKTPSVKPPMKAESDSTKPPSVKPPMKAESDSTRPPSVKPPVKAESDSTRPPSVKPPVKAESASIKPPSVKPPVKAEGAPIKPPSVKPPVKAESGPIKPASVKPPAPEGPTSVKPPAVKPPGSRETASVKPPAAKPPTSSSVRPPSTSSVKPPSVKPPSSSQESPAVKPPASQETFAGLPPKSAVKPPTKPGPPKSPPVGARSAVKPPTGKLSVQPPAEKVKPEPVPAAAEPEPPAPGPVEPEPPTRQGLVEKGTPRKLTKKGADGPREGKVRPGLVERTPAAEGSPKRGLVERSQGAESKRMLEKNPTAETAPKKGLVEKAGPASSTPASKPAVRPKELPRAMSAQRTETELAEIREVMLKEFLEFRPAEPTFTELGGGAAQVEERRAPRMKCSFKVRCFVGLSSFEAHVNEISLTGIRIETPERLAKGAIIEMHPATASGNVLAVRCEARWCRRISDSDVLSCGLAFTEDAPHLSRSWAAVVLHGISHKPAE